MGKTNSFSVVLALVVASSLILLVGCQQEQPEANQDQPQQVQSKQEQPQQVQSKQEQPQQEQQGITPPTEAEVKQTIEKGLTETYMAPNGGAIPNNVDFQFGDIQVGTPEQRLLDFGEEKLAYPVKTPVELTVTYSNNPKVRTEYRGNHPQSKLVGDDTFFFYKDGFGEWNFKTGKL